MANCALFCVVEGFDLSETLCCRSHTKIYLLPLEYLGTKLPLLHLGLDFLGDFSSSWVVVVVDWVMQKTVDLGTQYYYQLHFCDLKICLLYWMQKSNLTNCHLLSYYSSSSLSLSLALNFTGFCFVDEDRRSKDSLMSHRSITSFHI